MHIPIAAEHDYAVTEEDLQDIYDQQKEVLSEEELGKIAGGTSIVCVITSMPVTINSAPETVTATAHAVLC